MLKPCPQNTVENGGSSDVQLRRGRVREIIHSKTHCLQAVDSAQVLMYTVFL